MKPLRLFAGVLLSCLLFTVLGTPIPPSSSLAAQSQNEPKEINVWVNTNSGVYHCPGTRWYGNTKHGKYEYECAAIKEGNRPAYGKACGADCQSALTSPGPASSAKGSTPATSTRTRNPDIKVWVNTNSGVYHCPGTRWYGSTKQGEYMTQKKAQDGGYRPAYGKVCG